jgi:hypothetical protein
VNIRIARNDVRFRLSEDEAQRLLAEGELIENEAAVRFGVILGDGPTRLAELIAHIPRAEWQAALARAGQKDAGVYAAGLAVEIDVFKQRG